LLKSNQKQGENTMEKLIFFVACIAIIACSVAALQLGLAFQAF